MTAAVGPVYSIERHLSDHRKTKPWLVLKDGKPITYSERDSYPLLFDTRKQAQEKIDNEISYAAWLARLFKQDAAGVFEWNEQEISEIAKLAARLIENPLQWTMNGQHPFQTIARLQHDKDAEVLLSDNWIDAKRYHAEKRRVMAARVEAFKRAGLTLEVTQ